MEKFRSSLRSKISINGEYKEGVFYEVFQPPFHEFDIIHFQKILISCGVFHFSVSSLSQGRKSLFTFLSSIPLYQRKACISTNFNNLGEPIVYNVYQKLYEIWQNDSSYSFEQLWAEGQHFDFLWIEKTNKDNPIYTNLCHQALQIYKHKNICVIVLEEKA